MALSQTSGQLVIMVERKTRKGLQDPEFVRRGTKARIVVMTAATELPEVGRKLYKSV